MLRTTSTFAFAPASAQLLVVAVALALSPATLAQEADDIPLEGSAEDVPLEGESEDVPLEGRAEDVPLEGDAEDVPLEGDAEDIPLEGATEEANAPAADPAEATPPPPVDKPAEATPPADAPAESPAPAATNAEGEEVEEPEPSVADPDYWLKSRYKRRVGDPTPLTRREPTLKALQFEADARYGLVGTGPTRFVNDLRLGITDWFEVRTSLMPWPTSLMGRLRLGEHNGLLGAFLLDAGLSGFDAGIRLSPQEGEVDAGIRFYFEGGLSYSRAVSERFAVYVSTHARYRLSMLADDDQFAVAADAHVVYDLLPAIALSVGVGYAEVIGTKVQELAVNFAEVGRPGMSHFLLRNDGWSRSVTLPMALTYGRVESFDVDLFVTPRVWPTVDVIFGAGLRWRIQLIDLDEPVVDARVDAAAGGEADG